LLVALTLSAWDAAAKDKTEGGNQLIQAVKHGDSAQVKLLLDGGTDVNTRLRDGTTPLMWASIPGRSDLVRLLVERGADINAKTEDGSSALMWAAIMEQGDIVRLLKSHGAEVTLPIAALLGDAKEVQRLLEAGADANVKDRKGWTALMNAAQRGHVAVMKLLLENGANVGAHREDGSTAFMDAIGGSHTEATKLLINEGADLNETRHKDTDEYQYSLSPLMHGVVWGQSDLVRLLLKHGTEVNARGSMGVTALKAAKALNDNDIVTLLEENDGRE